MTDIALVTEAALEAPAEMDPYVANVLEEDRILTQALAARGLSVRRVDWARPDVDWSGFRAAVVRTTWHYSERPEEFRAWIERVSRATSLFNEPGTLRWNMDKRYLLELADAGIPTVPTEVLERGSRRTLAEITLARGWKSVVLKPVISGSGRHTYRVTAADRDEHEATLARLLADEAMMVQPFLPAIVDRGEVTIVMIDGEPTHALRKRARPGEFRVQDDHGGTLHDHTATPQELSLAQNAIALRRPMPLYGRVDLVSGPDGGPLVMELELIEPELWFRRHPPAAQRLAAVLATALG